MSNSHALPHYYYQDPQKVAEGNELNEMGCLACQKRTTMHGRVFCTEPKKRDQKGVPNIGHQCKWFKLEEI